MTTASSPIEQAIGVLRTEGGAMIRRAIAGDETLDPTELANDDDLGWFGPDSAVWEVHSSSAMLIGGLRALLLQTLHPLAMAGVAEHSDYKRDPWGRLHRTGRFVGATTYGTSTAAESAVETVRKVHERVTGFAPDGRPYAANDPHLLLWVHVTEVDSFLAAYRRYGNERLPRDRRDAYVAEMAIVAERLGSEPPPRSEAELAECLRRFRAECRGSRQSRDATRFLLNPPVNLVARPAYGIITAAAIGLLPGWSRRQLLLPTVPLVDPLAVQPAAKVLMATIGWLMGDDDQRRLPSERAAP
ncbi:MAG: oxygenase MpaB family protein [Acidimicrobiales bacterium]